MNTIEDSYMKNIGILAYGSLIEDPGIELKPLICERIVGIETPFSIEFARTSSSRDGAPTVVPVSDFGSPVKAIIMVLNENVSIERARDLLWRRETRKEGTNEHYSTPETPSLNQVVIANISGFLGLEDVLYTKIGANIDNLTPQKLATLAIESARAKAGSKGKDGISYLISVKNQNIETPLMKQYETEILRLVGADSLSEALAIVRKNV